MAFTLKSNKAEFKKICFLSHRDYNSGDRHKKKKKKKKKKLFYTDKIKFFLSWIYNLNIFFPLNQFYFFFGGGIKTLIFLYIYHHHHIALVARISLTLSRHSSLSFIALGRSSGQHPVSSHSCWMYVRAGQILHKRSNYK